MKKLLVALLALGVLSFAPTAEAGRNRRSGNCAPCKKEKPCASPCAAPKREVKVRKWIVQEPCKRMVCLPGTCDHEVCETTTVETTESKKCIGGCKVQCSKDVLEDANENVD